MKRYASLLLLCGASLLGGCEAGSPTPGGDSTLTVTLATPYNSDRSLLVTLSGPSAPGAVSAAASGYVVFTRTSGNVTRVAVFGPLNDGPLLRVTVPAGSTSGWSAVVNEAADEGNNARASVAGYALTVSR